MVDAPSATKMFETPVTPQATGSKTLFMGNLSFSIVEEDMRNFFKDAGKFVDVRFAVKEDHLKGYGPVEFATAEAAQEAQKLNGEDLLGRPVRLDLAKEMGPFTPGSSNKRPFQKELPAQGTVFVRGFDAIGSLENIKSMLEKHFGNCGEIMRTAIPKDYDSGLPKGYACIDFADRNGFNKALELNRSKVGSYNITVEEARPKDNVSGEGRPSGPGVRRNRFPARRDGKPSGPGRDRVPGRRDGKPSGPGVRGHGPKQTKHGCTWHREEDCIWR